MQVHLIGITFFKFSRSGWIILMPSFWKDVYRKAVIPVCILYVQYVTNFINVGLQLNQEKFSNKTRTLMETRLIVIYMYILLYKILYTYNDFSDKGIGFIAIFLYTSNGDLTLTIHIFPFYCCHCQYSYAF